jgi:hypothetical protein
MATDYLVITHAKYHNADSDTNTGIIATIDGIEMSVPLDPANIHYAAILEWVADGNTITAAGG